MTNVSAFTLVSGHQRSFERCDEDFKDTLKCTERPENQHYITLLFERTIDERAEKTTKEMLAFEIQLVLVSVKVDDR